MGEPMKLNTVGWFEIPVTDMQRAKAFYETVLEIELSLNQMGPIEMAWFPWDHEASGAAGSLCKGEGYEPCHKGSLVYLNVPEVEAFLASVVEAGGKELMPKTSIGEHGFCGQFEDTEGNRIACHSRE